MASKISLRRYGKYALVLCGAGISSYAVYRLIDQKKEVHFSKKKSKPSVKLKLLDAEVSHCLISYRFADLFSESLVTALASASQTNIWQRPAFQIRSAEETKRRQRIRCIGHRRRCHWMWCSSRCYNQRYRSFNFMDSKILELLLAKCEHCFRDNDHNVIKKW